MKNARMLNKCQKPRWINFSNRNFVNKFVKSFLLAILLFSTLSIAKDTQANTGFDFTFGTTETYLLGNQFSDNPQNAFDPIMPSSYLSKEFASMLESHGANLNDNFLNFQACTYSFTPFVHFFIEPGSATLTYSIQTQTGCTWNPTPNVSWIRVTAGGGNRTGSGQFTVVADPNSGSFRSGIVNIATGTTIPISQDGPVPACVQSNISYGAIINGNLTTSDCRKQGSYTKEYNFSGSVGDQIAILMTSPNFDNHLQLLAPDGSEVATSGRFNFAEEAFADSKKLIPPPFPANKELVSNEMFSPTGTDARIPASGNIPLTQTGTYKIRAKGGCFVGCTNTGSFTLSLTRANLTPTITSLNPSQAFAGSNGFNLTINGNSFVSGAVVRFNGTQRNVVSFTPNQLQVQILASDVATPGTRSVQVINPGGAASALATFTVNPPQTFQITGRVTDGVTSIGVPGVNISLSSSPLTAQTDSNGNYTISGLSNGTYTVTASQSGSTFTAITNNTVTINNSNPPAVNFRRNDPTPRIDSLSPAGVPVGNAEFTLTVNGSNFAPGAVVFFGGVQKNTNVIGSTSVQTQILASEVATAGQRSVQVINLAGSVPSNIVQFNVGSGACTAPSQINIGQSVAGSITANSCIVNQKYVDLYSFNGTAGQRIAITLNSAFSPTLELVDSQNNVLQRVVGENSARNIRLPNTEYFQLPAPGGIFTIRVISNSLQELGAYTLSLFQQPAVNCIYTLTPLRSEVSSNGGNGFFTSVTQQTGCPTPTVTVNAAAAGWLRVTGNGGGRISFTAGANPNAADREGTITVEGSQQPHTVKQFGNAPSPNDAFAAAAPITGSTPPQNIPITGRNTNAGPEQGERSHAGNPAARSVWFRWTAPSDSDGLYSFTTAGSDFDTVMAVYDLNALPTQQTPLQQVLAENDDTTTFDKTSKVNFRATAGRSYLIVIDGKAGASGVYNLSWKRFNRLYRFYTQTFNGDPSPRIPNIVATRLSDGQTFNAVQFSLGVFELDLPPDNSRYQVVITGGGVVWDPGTFIIDNSRQGLAETLYGPQEAFNESFTSNANSSSGIIQGSIRGIKCTTPNCSDLADPNNAALQVQVGSSRGANPREPFTCDLSRASGDQNRVNFSCEFKADTKHEIFATMKNKVFQESELVFPNPIDVDPLTVGINHEFSDVINSTTYDISGKVKTTGGSSVSDAKVKMKAMTGLRYGQTMSTGDGSYRFANLPAGEYLLTVELQGLVSTARTITLPATTPEIDLTTEGCSYSLPTGGSLINIGAAAGSHSFTVQTSSPQCIWNATPETNIPWLRINAGGGALGNGQVLFTVDANNSSQERQAVIRIGNATFNNSFTVRQSAATASAAPIVTELNPGGVLNGSPQFTINVYGSNFAPGATVQWNNQNRQTQFVSAVHLRAVITASDVQNVGNSSIRVVNPTPDNQNSNAAAFIVRTRNNYRSIFDFDGDKKADQAIFRPSNNLWAVLCSTAACPNGILYAYFWGFATDKLTAADYDGDSKTDIAVFRNGTWFIVRSSNGTFETINLGSPGDVPLPADFDGDGRADAAVYRAGGAPGLGSSFFYRRSSQPNDPFVTISLGQFGDKPLIGDFDADGKTDAAVYRPSNGTWYVRHSSNNQTVEQRFGNSSDIPVPADYNGDGKTELALYRPSIGTWYTSLNPAINFLGVPWGQEGDVPVPADFDGDGRIDYAVYRPSNGAWYTLLSSSGPAGVFWGANGDIPVLTANAP